MLAATTHSSSPRKQRQQRALSSPSNATKTWRILKSIELLVFGQTKFGPNTMQAADQGSEADSVDANSNLLLVQNLHSAIEGITHRANELLEQHPTTRTRRYSESLSSAADPQHPSGSRPLTECMHSLQQSQEKMGHEIQRCR